MMRYLRPEISQRVLLTRLLPYPVYFPSKLMSRGGSQERGREGWETGKGRPSTAVYPSLPGGGPGASPSFLHLFLKADAESGQAQRGIDFTCPA